MGPQIWNNVTVYFVCSTIVVSHSSCILSKHIKLLFLKTSNYARQSQILFYIFESTCISYYGIIYICIEVPIYCENVIWVVLCCSENKVNHLFINNNVLLNDID